MSEENELLKDDHFDEVTLLLKDAGDRAWAKMHIHSNGLWDIINQAEKAESVQVRKEKIYLALLYIEDFVNMLDAEDYDFIKDKLIQSDELTE